MSIGERMKIKSTMAFLLGLTFAINAFAQSDSTSVGPGGSGVSSNPIPYSTTANLDQSWIVNEMNNLQNELNILAANNSSGSTGDSGSFCGYYSVTPTTGNPTVSVINCQGNNPQVSCPSNYTRHTLGSWLVYGGHEQAELGSEITGTCIHN